MKFLLLQSFSVVIVALFPQDNNVEASLLRGLHGTENHESSLPAYSDRSTTITCANNSDCPQIQCFAGPCDMNYCINGSCTLTAVNVNPPEVDWNEDTAMIPDEEEGSLPSNNNSTVCGPSVCTGSQICCNESCGFCVEPGDACPDMYCVDEDGSSSSNNNNDGTTEIACGPSTCSVGEMCCNSSCGYCVLPGMGCSKEFCGLISPEEDADLPQEGEPEQDDQEEEDDGGWIKVTRGDCDDTCSEKCAVCQKLLGFCTSLGCGGD